MTNQDSSWIHPFERAGLGTAPFKLVGYERKLHKAGTRLFSNYFSQLLKSPR